MVDSHIAESPRAVLHLISSGWRRRCWSWMLLRDIEEQFADKRFVIHADRQCQTSQHAFYIRQTAPVELSSGLGERGTAFEGGMWASWMTDRWRWSFRWKISSVALRHFNAESSVCLGTASVPALALAYVDMISEDPGSLSGSLNPQLGCGLLWRHILAPSRSAQRSSAHRMVEHGRLPAFQALAATRKRTGAFTADIMRMRWVQKAYALPFGHRVQR